MKASLLEIGISEELKKNTNYNVRLVGNTTRILIRHRECKLRFAVDSYIGNANERNILLEVKSATNARIYKLKIFENAKNYYIVNAYFPGVELERVHVDVKDLPVKAAEAISKHIDAIILYAKTVAGIKLLSY